MGDYIPLPVTPTDQYPYSTDEEFVKGRYPSKKDLKKRESEDEQGHIDETPKGMKFVPNISSKEGSFKDSVTAEWDGITYIIPTTVDGQTLSDEEAIKYFQQNGMTGHMGAFDSLDNANAFRANDDEILDQSF
jgi:hypothetical protein